jgi:excisionase family DNA binding protein
VGEPDAASAPPAAHTARFDAAANAMSPPPLPLAAAQRRLGRPGRPKKTAPAAPTRQAPTSSAVGARLFTVSAAAAYLGVSAWTVRDLIASGALTRVRIPVASGGELRKVLVDRHDLDALIESWKE